MVERGDNQGASSTLDRGQVSVSPHGFGRQKNFARRLRRTLIPLFTGQVFFVAMGLLPDDSGDAATDLPIMRVWRWSDASREGMVALDSPGFDSS
jgi:hypothetical protein